MHSGNIILAPLRLNAIFYNFTQIHDLLKRLDQYNYTFLGQNPKIYVLGQSFQQKLI